jgi:predicted DCC family thiol-disulfide oxidoreductase YuxK
MYQNLILFDGVCNFCNGAVPQPLRDWAYSEFARQRFLLFGRREICMMPTPELQERFLS